MRETTLTIEQRTIEPGIHVLRLQGRVTLGDTARQLEEAVEGLIDAQAKRVVFDRANVKFVDSTGIKTIVTCAGRVKDSGGSACVAGAHGVVNDALKLLRVRDLVPVFASVDEAVASLAAD